MPTEMMHLFNDVVYGGKSKDGKGIALDENPEAKPFKEYLRKMYPSVKAEPEKISLTRTVPSCTGTSAHSESAGSTRTSPTPNAFFLSVQNYRALPLTLFRSF